MIPIDGTIFTAGRAIVYYGPSEASTTTSDAARRTTGVTGLMDSTTGPWQPLCALPLSTCCQLWLSNSTCAGIPRDSTYPIATIWWTGFSHIPGRITEANLMRIPITRAFYPTVDRPGPGPWLIDFWNLDIAWIFISLPMGILLTLLFYYDHNVSSITAQAKQLPLAKPAGFHWDFFLLGCTCFAAGIIGVPLPNGLVPQAPVHTDSCTVYEEVVIDRKEKDGDSNETTVPTKIVRAVEVKEQRVSHFLMALAFCGLMTGPLLDVLHTMPRALFAGVFFMTPRTKLSKPRILWHDLTRWFGVAASVAISQTIGAIGFPVIIIALIPLRWVILTRMFSVQELDVLDAPTANADVILASFGGQPERPEKVLAEKRRRNRTENSGAQEPGRTNTNSSRSSGLDAADKRLPSDERDAEPSARQIMSEGILNARERGVDSTRWTGHE
ncbi:hypothetical protein Q7P36_005333 [Cladosporium allicinum]